MVKCSLLPSVARKRLLDLSADAFSFEEEVGGGKHMATIATLPQFAQGYAAIQHRHFHEVIHGNRNCRLYIDIDGEYQGHASVEVVRQVGMDLFAEIQSLLASAYGMESPPPIIMTGCRAGKFSSHIVCNVGFETPAHCRGFAESLARVTTCPYTLDMAIYKSVYSAGTFRMPFSSKRGGTPMLPIDSPAFTVAAWAGALVTFSSDMAGVPGLLPRPQTVPVRLAIPPSVARLRFSESEEARGALYRQKVLNWLMMTLPFIRVREQTAAQIKISAYCRSAERVHRSNTMYLSYRSDGNVSAHCTDAECECDVPMLYTSQQMLLASIPLEIDWVMYN